MNKKLVSTTALGLSAAGLALLSQQQVAADSYTIQFGDSFYSIAQAHGMDVYDLAAKNGKTIDSLILPGEQLEVDGTVASSPQVAEETVVETPQDLGNTYPVGQCTWGVKEVAPWVSNWWGNANTWAVNAASQGYQTGYLPVVGSVAVWTSGVYGHVAYVTDVDPVSGKIQVMEANYGGSGEEADPRGLGNFRGWFNPDEQGMGAATYIYPN